MNSSPQLYRAFKFIFIFLCLSLISFPKSFGFLSPSLIRGSITALYCAQRKGF